MLLERLANRRIDSTVRSHTRRYRVTYVIPYETGLFGWGGLSYISYCLSDQKSALSVLQACVELVGKQGMISTPRISFGRPERELILFFCWEARGRTEEIGPPAPPPKYHAQLME